MKKNLTLVASLNKFPELPPAFTKSFFRKIPLRIVVFTVMGLLIFTSSFAQQWNILGNESQVASVASNYSSITVLDDIPYVVYVEGASTGGIGKVKRRNSSTGVWEQVGGDLSSNSITYTRIYNDNNNKLYVTYVDNAANSNRLAVLTYNAATQAWEPMVTGNPYVSTGSVTNSISQFSSTPRSGLAFDSNNNLYITFSERSAAYNTYVKSFVSGAWQAIGGGPVSTDTAVANNIALDNKDVPYIVYIKQTGTNSTAFNNSSGIIKALRFNSASNLWEDVSPPAQVAPGSATTGATTIARHTSIAMDSTYNPIVSYFNTSNSNKSTIVRFNKTTAVWNYIGTTSTRDAPYNTLVRDNGGNVYNAFIDNINSTGSNPQARIFKLGYGTPAFNELKSASSTGGIDNTSLAALNVAIGSDTSKPYVVYTKTNSGSVVTPIAQIFSRPVFTKDVTNITTTSATTGGEISSDGVSTITERGVVYSTSANPTTSNTKIADAAGGTGSFTISLTGLSIATAYHVRAYTISSTSNVTYGNDVTFATNPPDAGSVTVVDNGTTVTMKNSVVTVTITKSSATITNITYKGQNLLNGGYNGGQVYWSWNMPNYQNPSGCTYTLTSDPRNNNFNYAEIKLHMVADSTASTAALDMDIYYSLPRDSSGIYASATLRHPASYNHANPGGEWRMACYPGSTFNWLSVDSLRNKLMATNNDWGTPAAITGAPPENMLLTTGIRKNQYECKYDYSADFGEVDAWGWSSTTDNIGLWVTAPSKEYYNGGPLKRELMCHGSPTLLNMLNGQHYGMGDDGGIQAGETWEKTYGPFLIYCNSVPAGTANAPIALWKDALAQAKKEQRAWPYTWYTNPSYVKESGRGTITGTFAITDPTVPDASAANMWVGVAIPPATATSSDFQHWSKNYQFWVKTDANGNFTIPHVLPGTYNMYAFGPGAAGQMTLNAFVTVTAGNTSALGTVSWTPARTAQTVWEIGLPDRTAKEFFHGSDWWTSDPPINDSTPATHWAKFQDYTTEFPNGVNFTIGQSNIATAWNYVMPYDNTVQSTSPVWTINFNLASAPAAGSTASIYAALATNFSAALIAQVNGTNITNPTTGVTFGSKSDAMIRMGIHGAFAETRISFPASNLHAGANTITFTERITGGATNGDIMFDYVRLEAAAAVILPLELLPLKGNKSDKTNVLTWETASEQNTSRFDILRGDNPAPVNAIGTVTAKGNSTVNTSYKFIDNAPLTGANYYRLRMIDKDGKTTYSNTVLINTAEKNSGISVYPNPVSSQVFIHSTTGDNIQSVQLYDLRGSLLFSNYDISATETTINVASFPAGLYTIKVRSGDTVVTEKINKQ